MKKVIFSISERPAAAASLLDFVDEAEELGLACEHPKDGRRTPQKHDSERRKQQQQNLQKCAGELETVQEHRSLFHYD